MFCISFRFFIRSCTFYCKPNIWFSPAIVLKKWPFARVSCLYQYLQNKGSNKQANKLYWLRDSPGKGYNKIFKNVDTTDKCRPQKNGRQNLFSRPIRLWACSQATHVPHQGFKHWFSCFLLYLAHTNKMAIFKGVKTSTYKVHDLRVQAAI